jgi:hypothetical protein
MNGLERTGDHGLFYYVVEIEQLVVRPGGTVRFEIGERALFKQRPVLSRLGGVGDGGFVRSRMLFSGGIEGGDLVLRCEDNDGSCPAFTLAFRLQDKLVGLLTLPEVFGAGACDKFTPAEIPLYAAPDSGTLVGSIRVDQYWTFHDVGGCEGLTVNVHRSDRRGVRELPVKEHAYEDPGAVVLEQRGRWFKVRLADGAAWLHASPRAEYLSLERLLEDGLTYLTDHWDGRLAKAPDTASVEIAGPRAERSVRVIGFQEHRGQRWVEVAVLSDSPCTSNEKPRVAARGWLPAHALSGEPTIWFYSRGC